MGTPWARGRPGGYLFGPNTPKFATGPWGTPPFRLGDRIEVSWRPDLGRLRSVLERFWRRLGPSWGPTWVQVAPQDAAKIDKKSIPKLINFLMPLEIGFWMDFNGFWDGKWRQVGTKIDQKSMSSAKTDFLKNRALAAAGA